MSYVVEQGDVLEARLIFNECSRIYQYKDGHIGIRDFCHNRGGSQANRTVEAACIALLLRADPDMAQFRIKSGVRADAHIRNRVEKGEEDIIGSILEEMEKRIAQFEGLSRRDAQDEAAHREIMINRAADIAYVLKHRPEEGGLFLHQTNYPEAVSFANEHEEEAAGIVEQREQADTLYIEDFGGFRLTDAFWSKSLIRIEVDPELFKKVGRNNPIPSMPRPPS